MADKYGLLSLPVIVEELLERLGTGFKLWVIYGINPRGLSVCLSFGGELCFGYVLWLNLGSDVIPNQHVEEASGSYMSIAMLACGKY